MEEHFEPQTKTSGSQQDGLPDPASSDDSSLAARFMRLFAGRQDAYGTFEITGSRDTGKQTGRAITMREPVTERLWADHLSGAGTGIGIIPIRPDSTCLFGAVDVDVYADFDPATVAKQAAALRLPIVPCRSKSGGVHAYLFAKEPVPAHLIQARLREIAIGLGYPTAEVFPKQVAIEGNQLGNFINMPYKDGDRSNRFALTETGDPLSVEAFVARAESSRVGLDWFKTPLRLNGEPKVLPDSQKKRFTLPETIGNGKRDTTLTSMAGSMRRMGASEESILAALRETNRERCHPPHDDADLRRIAKSVGRYEPKHNGDDVGLTKQLGEAITLEDWFAKDSGDLLYRWEGGVYKPTGRRFIERKVKELCEAWQKTKNWSPELSAKVEHWIRVDARQLWECPPLDVLNCRNGLLEIETRTLHPHSPDHLSPVQIGASFDAKADCPHIDKFVTDVFPTDTYHLPFEVASWLMLPDTSIQKAVLALGEGANGKSVWMNLMMTFLGRENVSTLSLHRLEADKFASARLVGKLCNVGADLPTAALAGTSMFKALTGGDTITAERKFESSFEFRPFARLLFSANSAPRSDDDSSHGFFRRWLVIPFNRTFDEKDPNAVPRAVLDARLTQPRELSGLLNRALDALPAVRRGRFTESGSTKAALDDFRKTTDPLSVWLTLTRLTGPKPLLPRTGCVSRTGRRALTRDARYCPIRSLLPP